VFSFKLGVKNLTRQKRRNFITILVIAFAFFIYLFIGSMMEGMEEMSFNNIKDYDTGSIQVAHPAYWEDKDKLPLENTGLMKLPSRVWASLSSNITRFLLLKIMSLKVRCLSRANQKQS
jgi:ABC-type lipoprotein release transport system permease subunit